MPKRDKRPEGIEAWKETFYQEPEKKDTDYTCAIKTRLKYSGAKESVLEEYNLAFLPRDCSIAGAGGAFNFSTTTCSFCNKYLKGDKIQLGAANCKKCPIAREGLHCNHKHSAWRALSENHDPQPMLEVVERIIEKCKGPNWSYKAR